MNSLVLTVRYDVVNLWLCLVKQVFRPYAKFWLCQLLELILCHEFSSDAGEATGINYFINDVLVTLLSWHQIAVPQVCIMASDCHNGIRLPSLRCVSWHQIAVPQVCIMASDCHNGIRLPSLRCVSWHQIAVPQVCIMASDCRPSGVYHGIRLP